MKSIAFPKMFENNSTKVISDYDATKRNLESLLLCEKGEFVSDPFFGIRLKRYLYEQNNYVLRDNLWIWGHDAGCHHSGAGLQWKIPGTNKMGPVEGAEYLGIPNVSNVLSVDDFRDNTLYLTTSLDDKIVSLSVPLPCLISVDGDINTPRLPSYKIRKTLTDDAVTFLTFADFPDQQADHYGLSGSATQVERIFPPEKLSDKQTFTGDADTQAQLLFELLREKKML